MASVTAVSDRAIARLPVLERLDVGLVERLRPLLETPAAQKLGKLGRLGDDSLLLLLSIGLTTAGLATRNGRLQRSGFRMLVAQLVAKGAKELGKSSVDRTRPAEQLEEGRYVARRGSSRSEALRSFPSGHTASALAVARAFSREYPSFTRPVLTAAAVVGALQVPRRANYPGDVAAGAGAGMLAEKAADMLIAGIERVRRRRAPQAVPAPA
ncbi:MAG: phosphatase PAP2 family protein [Sphingobium sp.]